MIGRGRDSMEHSEPVLSANDLLEWSDVTAQRWRELVNESPAVLSIPCDVRGSSTVADLLLHIAAAELRYAEQLSGFAPTDYKHLSSASPEAIFGTHDRAIALYRTLLLQPSYPWNELFTVTTRSAGELIATRRDVFLHGLLHGIRHYAQLATLARHHGYPPQWQMDFLFLHAHSRM